MKNVKLFDTFIKVNEAMNKPNTMAKDVFRDATDALTKTMGGRKLDKKYVKDYLKSIEQMARKNPGQLVKDYGDFDINDWLEDVEYNLQNEGNINERGKDWTDPSADAVAEEFIYEFGPPRDWLEEGSSLKAWLIDDFGPNASIYGKGFSEFYEEIKEYLEGEGYKFEDEFEPSNKYVKESKVNEKVSEKEVFAYLRDLRDSGKTNMFGAGEYLEKAFNLDKRTARELLTKWMKSF